MPTGNRNPCRDRPCWDPIALQRQEHAGHAAGLGRQLQATPSDQIKARQFCDGGRHARSPQRFLERPDAIGRTQGAHQNQAACRHRLTREARAERFQNGRDPNQGALRPLRQPQPVSKSKRQGRPRPRLSANMVKAGDRQPATLKMRIHPRQARWPYHGRATAALQRAQFGAQSG